MKILYLMPLMFLSNHAPMTANNDNHQGMVDVHTHIIPEYDEAPDSLESEMLVRISEIEVYPEYLDEYLAFARNVGAESVRKEPGVICIYPMIQKRDSCQIRILEIYAGQEAYKEHIASEHFQTYKQGTLHMVKSLDLVDMTPMNPEGMDEIFRKTNFDNISKKQ